ncbi:MAG: 4-alpha-glucanotransferase [Thermodesulfovibrionales bacterium]
MQKTPVDELAGLCGIIPGYYDIKGNYVPASIRTKIAILHAMGYDLNNPDALKDVIEAIKLYPWLDIIEPVHIFSISEPVRIPLYIPVKNNNDKRIGIKVSLFDEKGKRLEDMMLTNFNIQEERFIHGRLYIKIEYEQRGLKECGENGLGYFDLEVVIDHSGSEIDGITKRSKIIIAPERAYLPPGLEKKRCWGLSVNLYSLRSADNWGCGDLGDLSRLIPWLSRHGAALIAINPLHALANTIPFGISPYSPLSRLYKNFIYLDMSELCAGDEFKKEILKLKDEKLIDYEKIASLKLSALKKAFKSFLERGYKRNTSVVPQKIAKFFGDPFLAEEFRRYVLNESGDLKLFATYMALSEKFQTTDWQRWPAQYHDPESVSVKEFIEENKEHILFFQYIQWLIDYQHSRLYRKCREVGLSIGLYHDLAIGAVKESFDVWANKGLFCLDLALGAPPDDFSPDGQNWGLPPINPLKLRQRGYDLFIKTLRKNMQYAGALRIDHALGLFRQFWIPSGEKASEGAYVSFPSQDLLRIIALESIRNKTIIIAEDLGTVGENVGESLKNYGMLSYRLFYFERNYPDPSFLGPSRYPELSLSAITTHDLPTIYGFWKGVDIEQRKELGKYPDERTYIMQMEERQRDRLLIIEALKREGILKGDYLIPEEMTEELCLAIYNYLARTPSKIVLVSLDDITGAINQQNMPGTVDTYPNWRQKTVIPLEEILQDKKFMRLAQILEKEGRKC